MVNRAMERRKEQEEARLEYERQTELRPEPQICAVVTFADIQWLKECGIVW